MAVVRMFGAGDVFPNVPDGRASFRHLTPLLETADIVVANCEGVYSDRPAPSPSHKHMMVAPRERGAMLGEAPFHVMSLANNHMMDGGYDGLYDTMELLRSQGIEVTGAGASLEEALRPAILERNGLRVAFVGICSVFPVGYEARERRPGIAALRVQTHYADPDRNFWEPAIDPAIATAPFPGDLERCRQAVRAARESADVVVALCHWGYSSRLEQLDAYELELGRDMVDSGADVVMCCHHHSLRGVEFRRGRPIFYGLGTLVHHLPTLYPPAPGELDRRRAKFGDRAHIPTAEFPLFPFNPDARMSGIATFDFEADGTIDVGLIPAQILADGSTEPLTPGDKRAETIADYLERITDGSGFASEVGRGERDGYAWLSLSDRSVTTDPATVVEVAR